MDAVGDLAGRLFGERHQHDPLGREVLVAEEELQDLGDDGGGLARAGARFDDEVAPLRRGGGRDAERNVCCAPFIGASEQRARVAVV